MRVCYVLNEYPVASQTFVHAELVALRALGVEVGVVAFKDGERGVRFGDGPDGTPFPNLWNGNPKALMGVVRRFEHLHGHFADFGVRVLAQVARDADRPWSMTCHAYDLFRVDACVRSDEWRALPASCRSVVTISRFHARFLEGRGCDPSRIRVIPNAARLAEILASAPPPPQRCRKVLAVGRPVAKKGFPVLVNAWARARQRVPDLELEIIGGEGLVPNPPAGLTLSPMRPYAAVLAAMAAADVIVAPSIVAPDGDMDGIPTVLVEAGALRRPVVASDLSGISDLVVDGVNGFLVPPGDVDALAISLLRLATRPAEVQRLGSGGPTLAAPHDSRAVAERLLSEAFAA
jgi:glycosyltransferase involved in cell wall biosynthesis